MISNISNWLDLMMLINSYQPEKICLILRGPSEKSSSFDKIHTGSFSTQENFIIEVWSSHMRKYGTRVISHAFFLPLVIVSNQSFWEIKRELVRTQIKNSSAFLSDQNFWILPREVVFSAILWRQTTISPQKD